MSENIPLEYLKANIGNPNSKTPSGLGRWLNGVIIEVEKGKLVMQFEVREDMTNPTKMLHGGAISAIMDEMMGGMVMCLGKPTYYTSVNLQVDFFAPAKIGDMLEATADVIKEGRQIIHASCDLVLLRKKRLIARASSNLMRTDLPVNFEDPDA
jgi:uncharacterized protein (TIGR00369 family)